MADAKITLTVDGVQHALDDVLKVKVGLNDVGGASSEAGAHLTGFTKYLDGLTPSTTNAHAAFTDLKGTLTGMWENPTQAVSGLASAVGGELAGGLGAAGVAAGLAVGAFAAVGAAAFGLASHAASVGAELDDLADKTGMSVPALSRLSNASAVIGADMGKLTDVVFKLEKGLGENTETFQSGLAKMGLSTAELKAAGPDKYLELVTAGLNSIPDASDRAAAGTAVLGKGYKDVAAALQDLSTGLALTADIKPFTTEQAKEAEHFEQQLKSMKVHAEALAISIGQELIPQMTDLARVAGATFTALSYVGTAAATVGRAMGASTGAGMQAQMEETASLRAQIEGVVAATLQATPSVKAFDDAIKSYTVSGPLAASAADVEKAAVRELSDTLKGNTDARKAAQKAADELAQSTLNLQIAEAGYDGALAMLGDNVVEAIRYELDHKGSVQDIARVYHVAAESVTVIQDRLKDEKDAVKSATDAHRQMAAELKKIEDSRSADSISALDKMGAAQMKASQTEFENLSKSLAANRKAHEDYDRQVESLTLSSYDVRERDILRHLDDEKLAVKALGGNWEDTWAAMTATANTKIDAIEWDRIQDRIDETDQAMEDWINHSVALLGQLGDSIGRIAGIDLGGVMAAFGETGLGQKATAFLDSHAITSTGGKLAMAGVSAGVDVLEQATEDPATKAGQVANSAAKGAQIGTMIMPGWGTAIGAGVGAVVGALKVSPEEIAARTSLEGFMKQFGTLGQTIQAVGATYAAYGKTGVQAEHDLKAALDASHVSVKAEEAALKTINDVMTAQKQHAADVADGIQAVGPAFDAVIAGTADAVKGYDALKKAVDDARQSQVLATQKGDSAAAVRSAMDLVQATRAQASAADGAKQELADLGVQAVASFASAVAGGASVADALKAVGPGLDTLKQSYTDLGLDVEDVALKSLMMQNSIVEGNPTLLNAIAGLSSEMDALDKIGGMNVDTFGSMERTGMQMYSRLQAQVAAVGGTTKDALIPMQGFLHDAMTEATNLGVPLDDNTQRLIDQSTELGIWKDTGKSASEILDLSMKAVVDRIGQLIDKLSGPGGVTDAIGKIPRHVDVDVQASYRGPGAPPPSPDGTGADGAATGGWVTASGIQHFSVGGFVGGPRGTDTVPAWLTPGEVVLNRNQQKAIFGGMNTRALEAQIADLRTELQRSNDRFDRTMNTLPMMLKHALRGL
ncbi:MAG: hypothetical protein ABJA98_19240 [Acidobacteriota bacterium]